MGLRPTSPTRPITPDCPRSKHISRFGMWQKLQNLFNRDGSIHGIDSDNEDAAWQQRCIPTPPKQRGCSSARPVGIGLPRQATFKRQNSEKRDRLCLVEPTASERRAYSSSRQGPTTLTTFRSNSVPPTTSLSARSSAPAIGNTSAIDSPSRHSFDIGSSETYLNGNPEQPLEYDRVRPPRPASVVSSTGSFEDQEDYLEDRNQLNRELDTKWILNLSMHFRDKSDREKFFVTYAETPTHWRRVTVSCDYRHAEPGSLEMDLKELQLQRDKSLQIYEAIRESLTDIKFYDTVTNLKLETTDGRLHVHVTEDVNEIIPYPPISSINHIIQESDTRPQLIRESELSFEAHLSGFVYKVSYRNKPYIKKEIPGPDTIDEFLYEVNALHSLHDSRYVINLEAIITDDSGQIIKGLLIKYAERGAVVDLLYDYKGEILWEDRERWARHAIQGLSDIHEEGYVQGDFTLSNIVVDDHDNAQIIDINRRGCPVGWEPPEIAKKIASNQRISMYIGQKSDLYQLGMTLWALAMDDDEPERHDPPLSTQEFPSEVPPWFQEIIRICLSVRPRDRLSATDLIKLFPPRDHNTSWSSRGRPVVRIRTEKQYIDPAAAVERDDLERFGHTSPQLDGIAYSPESSRDDPTFTWPQSSNYDRDYDSASSEIERPRGRRRISDHDSELRAQRHNAARMEDRPLVNGVHDNSAPVISISSDGNEAHIIDAQNDAQQNHESTYESDAEHSREDGHHPPSPQLFNHSLRADRLLFPNHSETSDETPRNGSLQLFGSIAHSPDHMSARSYSDTMTDELTGLGTHPNMSEHSFERFAQHDYRNDVEDLISPFPGLTFADSGYDEPKAFGIESQNEYFPDDKIALNGIEESTIPYQNGIEVDDICEDLSVDHDEQQSDANVMNETSLVKPPEHPPPKDERPESMNPSQAEGMPIIEVVDHFQDSPEADSFEPQHSSAKPIVEAANSELEPSSTLETSQATSELMTPIPEAQTAPAKFSKDTLAETSIRKEPEIATSIEADKPRQDLSVQS